MFSTRVVIIQCALVVGNCMSIGIAKPGSQAIIATVFGNYMINVFTGLDDANEVGHRVCLWHR